MLEQVKTARWPVLLERWFMAEGRVLPWRERLTPYRVWVAEAMLQQTRVEKVIPYFEAWTKRWPDVADLVQADEQSVLKHWEGLGYYARARHLRLAAQQVMQQYGGVLPSCVSELQGLPGVGRYTAGAIASIGYNRAVPLVDGNVARVLSRLYALDEPWPGAAAQRRLWRLASLLVVDRVPRVFNQGLMELGALICRPRQPLCARCPVQTHCAAWQRKQVLAYPRRLAKRAPRALRGVLLCVHHGSDADGNSLAELLRRRPSRGLWGGLWEYPWLESTEDELPHQTLTRLLGGIQQLLPSEGLCASAARELGEELGVVTHQLTHITFQLSCYGVQLGHPPGQPVDAAPRAQPDSGASPLQMQHLRRLPRGYRWFSKREWRQYACSRLTHKARTMLQWSSG